MHAASLPVDVARTLRRHFQRFHRDLLPCPFFTILRCPTLAPPPKFSEGSPITGRLQTSQPGCWLTGILRRRTHFHPSGFRQSSRGSHLAVVGVLPTGIHKSSWGDRTLLPSSSCSCAERARKSRRPDPASWLGRGAAAPTSANRLALLRDAPRGIVGAVRARSALVPLGGAC
eukprot:COSAG01_NODE_7688_length_3098_cov_71.936646_3_plen_173_part_00